MFSFYCFSAWYWVTWLTHQSWVLPPDIQTAPHLSSASSPSVSQCCQLRLKPLNIHFPDSKFRGAMHNILMWHSNILFISYDVTLWWYCRFIKIHALLHGKRVSFCTKSQSFCRETKWLCSWWFQHHQSCCNIFIFSKARIPIFFMACLVVVGSIQF